MSDRSQPFSWPSQVVLHIKISIEKTIVKTNRLKFKTIWSRMAISLNQKPGCDSKLKTISKILRYQTHDYIV